MTAIGHNQPPAFDAFSMALDDVYDEAKNFLDGAPVESKGQADAIGLILTTARKLRKDADAERASEKKPHDEAGKAVQAKWKPLLDRADNIITAAQKPLAAFLAAEDERQREAARKAREEAERLAREAQEAHAAAAGNLAALEHAEAMQKDAKAAAKDAARADKARPQAAGEGKALGLRSYWTHHITDRRELLNWVAKNDPDALTAMLDEYARRAVAGGTRWLPGVEITQEKRVA